MESNTIVQSEYKVGRCTRRCQVQNRPLAPGEWYYSVVTEGEDEESLLRSDISAQAWQGPPEGTLGWWKSRMPAAGAKKLKLAPDAVLVDLLRQSDVGSTMLSGPLRYLLTLMLLRRRLIQPVETSSSTAANAVASDEQLFEILDDGTQVTVKICPVSSQETQRLGDQLVELLYCEAD